MADADGIVANSAVPNGTAATNCNTERLLKRLANLESIVYELLSLKKSTPVLKEKLSQIDDLILDIPDEETDLATDWRNKVATWWKKYAAGSAEEHHGGGSSGSHRGHRGAQPPIGYERRGGGGGYDRQSNYNDGSRSFFATRRRSPNSGSEEKAGPGGPNPYQFPSKEEYHEEREKIRSELAQDFAGLRALESGALDIDALKRLHGVVRKARTQTHPFDAALKEEIFCFAYRKLSPEKREKFLEQFGSNRMLVNLANFLRGQVEAYFQDLDIVKSGDSSLGGQSNYQQGSSRSMRNGFRSDAGDGSLCYVQNFDGHQQGYQRGGGRGGGEMTGDGEGRRGHYREPRPEVGPNQCRYCRQEGHRILECAERNSKLCFSCGLPGHTSKYCKNDKVVVTTDGASISN